MGSYDNRTQSAYGDYMGLSSPKDCTNPYILEWWTDTHDQVLLQQIEEEQWAWYWGVADRIVAMTPRKAIAAWKTEDPLCSRYAWYNVIMHFAVSRAGRLGLTKHIRRPAWKTCLLCNHRFVEDSLPYPLIRRLGTDHLDYCSPCLKELVLQGTGDDTLSREEVLEYLRNLAEVLQRVPPQGFGEGIDDFRSLDPQERLSVLRILKRKPSARRARELFGSWLEALVQARVLQDGTRRTGRGVQCLAKDGHVCLSLGEKTIDDFLYTHGIAHDIERPYPEGNYRADFLVNGVFVEYFGLKGNAEYDAKIRVKQKLCKKHGIRLVAIYPSDLVSSRKLQKKLLALLDASD